jgi:AraC-like DNA-binding protein
VVNGSDRIASLRRARDLMDLRFADPLDLEQMAAQAGFSKFHFARAFKDAYGETPANYLSRRRVERAKDLLRSANLTVTEVCMLVGFSSLGSFSSRFSEMVGMSPSAFQRGSRRGAVRHPFPGVSSWTGGVLVPPGERPPLQLRFHEQKAQSRRSPSGGRRRTLSA